MNCNICNKTFFSNQSLERHKNKKIKCSIKTEFKCDICNKYFKQKNNLNEHIKKKICKLEQVVDNSPLNINKAYIDILKSDQKLDDKIFFIQKLNNTISKDEIIKIIDAKYDMNTTIALLSTKASTIINSNNTNTNTNNIQINNFGNEKIDYITNDFLVKLINNNYGEDLLLKLSDKIYLNEKHPENKTIKIDNLTNKYCKIIEKNKWITTTKENALKKIKLFISDLIEICMSDNENVIPEKKRKIVSGYIEKEYEEIAESIEKLILKIYNNNENII
jgi:hypothetical protein